MAKRERDQMGRGGTEPRRAGRKKERVFFFFFKKGSVLKERWRMKGESGTLGGDAVTVSDSGFFCKRRKSIVGRGGVRRGDGLGEEEQED